MQPTRRSLIGMACAAGAIATAQPKLSPRKFVRAEGRELVAPSGEKLLLRGINLGNWLEPEGYMFLFEGGPQSPREIETFFNELIGPAAAEKFWRIWRRDYITSADCKFIRRCGFNSVRVPLHFKFFMGDAGFNLLDPLIECCRDQQLWVILDIHCAPGGQTGTNIDDSYGYPWLYESPADQQLLIDIWKRIAAHYRDEPIVLGYDLLNEPIPHFPQLRKYNAVLEPLYRRITKAIREVDPNHLIILGGAQWDSNFAVFGPPFDNQLIYQFHKYWTATTRDVISDYLAFRDKYNVPIWCGESGENTDAWVHDFVQTLETNNVGWCFWPYKKLHAASCVVSVLKPAHWDEIVAFAKMPPGTGNAEKRIAARPAIEDSRAALNSLLDAILFEKCRSNPGYIQALGLKIS